MPVIQDVSWVLMVLRKHYLMIINLTTILNESELRLLVDSCNGTESMETWQYREHWETLVIRIVLTCLQQIKKSLLSRILLYMSAQIRTIYCCLRATVYGML
mmetsp:Transcript_60051/g.167570  ORF Transcript_60051/g.167570 Transcript_60051/m.167570 type:complete len:102 (-) Transcript_60051:324-629(-)